MQTILAWHNADTGATVIPGSLSAQAISGTTGTFSGDVGIAGDLTLKGGTAAFIVRTSDDSYNAVYADANTERGQLLLYNFGVYKVKLTASAACEFLNGISATTGTFSGAVSGTGLMTLTGTDLDVQSNVMQLGVTNAINRNWQVLAGTNADSAWGNYSLRFMPYDVGSNGDLVFATGGGSLRIGTGVAGTLDSVSGFTQVAEFSSTGATFSGIVKTDDTTEATTTTDGSLQTDGGLSVAKKGVFGDTVKVGAYTLPATDGTAGQVLVTNGSGVLTWTTL